MRKKTGQASREKPAESYVSYITDYIRSHPIVWSVTRKASNIQFVYVYNSSAPHAASSYRSAVAPFAPYAAERTPHPHSRPHPPPQELLPSDTEQLADEEDEEPEEERAGSGPSIKPLIAIAGPATTTIPEAAGSRQETAAATKEGQDSSMAVARKKQDDKYLLALRELVTSGTGGNRQCFDCGQKGPTYVNMTIGSFVCTRCSGVL